MHVIIMRGITGSGKSSIARRLFKSGVICSADDWFDKKKMRWNPRFLSEAHDACYAKFMDAIGEEEPLIVVDNTNLKTKDFSEYVEDAIDAGYDVTFFHVMCDPAVAIEKSKHRDKLLEQGLKAMWSKHNQACQTPECVDGERIDSTEVWTSSQPGPEPSWDEDQAASSLVSTTT